MRICRYFSAALFAVCLCLGFWVCLQRFGIVVKGEGRSYTEMRDELRKDLRDNFYLKDECITLNGGVARLLSQRRCNGVYRLPNGQLLRPFPRENQIWRACCIKRLSKLVENEGVKFVFVLLPNKIVYGEKMFPGGWCHGNDGLYDNADELLGLLSSEGVDTLDLRPVVCPNDEAVERNFFKTDHHWNFVGAFEGFRYLANELSCRTTGMLLDEHPYLQCENWEKRSMCRKRNCFLGSNGRRTGPLFGGYDTDYVYFVPKFPLELGHSYRSRGTHKLSKKRGSFEETMIRAECVKEPVTIFKDMAYSVYYTDLAESYRENATAPCQAKLLIIKDSYAIPLLPMFSSVFKEVVALDMRYDPSLNVVDAIRKHRPNIVALMYNPSSFLSQKNKLWNFGGSVK